MAAESDEPENGACFDEPEKVYDWFRGKLQEEFDPIRVRWWDIARLQSVVCPQTTKAQKLEVISLFCGSDTLEALPMLVINSEIAGAANGVVIRTFGLVGRDGYVFLALDLEGGASVRVFRELPTFSEIYTEAPETLLHSVTGMFKGVGKGIEIRRYLP